MDEVLSNLRTIYPQHHISTPLALDQDSAHPLLIATWPNYSSIVLPSVDYVIVTNWVSRERWPSIVGYLQFEDLQQILGAAVKPVDLDGSHFYAIDKLDESQIESISSALSSGLPVAKE